MPAFAYTGLSKSGKAVKAKRSERKDKQRAATEMERLMHPRRARS